MAPWPTVQRVMARLPVFTPAAPRAAPDACRLAFFDDGLLECFAQGWDGQSRSAADQEHLTWAHEDFGTFLAAEWLTATPHHLEEIQGTGDLVRWGEAVVLGGGLGPANAQQLAQGLLDGGGNVGLHLAARLVGEPGVRVDLDTLTEVVVQALQDSQPEDRLWGPFDRSDTYVASVWALAPKLGPVLIPMLARSGHADMLGVVGQWWPEHACAALVRLARRADEGQTAGMIARKAVLEIARIGRYAPSALEGRARQAALDALAQIPRGHLDFIMAMALRNLPPLPETCAVIERLAPFDSGRVALIHASTLSFVGARYPTAVSAEALAAVQRAIPDDWWAASSEHRPLRLILQALVATRATYDRAPIAELAELLVDNSSLLKDLAGPNRWLEEPLVKEDDLAAAERRSRLRRLEERQRPLWQDEAGVVPANVLAESSAIAYWRDVMTARSLGRVLRSMEPEDELAFLHLTRRWPRLFAEGASEAESLEVARAAVGEVLRWAGVSPVGWRRWLFQVLREALDRWGEQSGIDAKVIGFVAELKRPTYSAVEAPRLGEVAPDRAPNPTGLPREPVPELLVAEREAVPVSKLVELGRSDDQWERWLAHQGAEVLIADYPWTGLDHLVRLAEHGDDGVDSSGPRFSQDLLSTLGDKTMPNELMALVERMPGQEWSQRLQEALERLVEEATTDELRRDVIPRLKALRDSPSAPVQRAVALASGKLAQRAPRDAMRLLEGLEQTGHPAVQLAVVWGAEEVGLWLRDPALDLIHRLRSHEDPDVRKWCRHAEQRLRQHHGQETKVTLTGLLGRGEDGERLPPWEVRAQWREVQRKARPILYKPVDFMWRPSLSSLPWWPRLALYCLVVVPQMLLLMVLWVLPLAVIALLIGLVLTVGGAIAVGPGARVLRGVRAGVGRVGRVAGHTARTAGTAGGRNSGFR
jgi:hypothetical protein